MAYKRCYLICSSVALVNKPGVLVSHYVGKTVRQPAARLKEHATMQGAKLTAAFIRAGGTLTITRVWGGAERDTETRIKAYGKLHLLCPACNPRAMFRKPKGLRKGKKVNICQ